MFQAWFRAVATGVMVALSLLVFDVIWWKALTVGAAAYLFCVQQFARRIIERIAFPLMLYAITVWIGAAPPPQDIRTQLADVSEAALTHLNKQD